MQVKAIQKLLLQAISIVKKSLSEISYDGVIEDGTNWYGLATQLID